MSPPSPASEFYAAEYASLLRAGKWLGSLLVLAHGGQVAYDLAVWVPRMTEVLDAMVEGGRDRWPAAIGFLGSYLVPLTCLAVLLIFGGMIVIATRSRLSAVVVISGVLSLGFWAFGVLLNKVLIAPLVTIVSSMGG